MLYVSRREFLAASAASVAASSVVTESVLANTMSAPQRFKKAVKYHMITGDTKTPLEKLKLIKQLGYDGVEIRTTQKGAEPTDVLAASKETGLPIHGVVNSSNPDIKTAVDRATFYGASSVLVVAGRVNEKKSYSDNYKEWQPIIKQAATYAKDNGIMLLVENVWNNFLLSPLEMAGFIDEMDSDAVGVYFDVGNVVRFGWPEHWIPALGNRIKKLDIKEYSRQKQRDEGLWKGFGVKIGEGSIDWPKVVQELEKINFQGWATAEVPGGGKEELADIASRMNRVLHIQTRS